MEKISLSRFRDATKHKKVKWIWYKKDGSKIKEFTADKFYCNPYGRGKFKLLSMPQFNLSTGGQFFQKDEKEFSFISEYGRTEFEVEE